MGTGLISREMQRYMMANRTVAKEILYIMVDTRNRLRSDQTDKHSAGLGINTTSEGGIERKSKTICSSPSYCVPQNTLSIIYTYMANITKQRIMKIIAYLIRVYTSLYYILVRIFFACYIILGYYMYKT